MKSGGTIKKVKKMAKGGAAGANFGYPLNGLPMRPTNGNTDISKNQMGTNPTMKKGGMVKKYAEGGKAELGPVYSRPTGGRGGAGTYEPPKTNTTKTTNTRKTMKKGGAMKKMAKGGFPDLTGDNKVTKADILKGRGVIKRKGGSVKKK